MWIYYQEVKFKVLEYLVINFICLCASYLANQVKKTQKKNFFDGK